MKSKYLLANDTISYTIVLNQKITVLKTVIFLSYNCKFSERQLFSAIALPFLSNSPSVHMIVMLPVPECQLAPFVIASHSV